MTSTTVTLERGDHVVSPGRNFTKAAVCRRREGGTTLAVKTVRRAPLLRRFGVAGVLLRREVRMLERLASVRVVPRLVRADRQEFATEWIEGETVGSRGRRGVSAREADQVRAALARLHAAGFAHGGIGRTDLLLTCEGAAIIDLATSVGPGSPPVLGRVLSRLLQPVDLRRVGALLRRARRNRVRHALLELAVEHDPGRTTGARLAD